MNCSNIYTISTLTFTFTPNFIHTKLCSISTLLIHSLSHKYKIDMSQIIPHVTNNTPISCYILYTITAEKNNYWGDP